MKKYLALVSILAFGLFLRLYHNTSISLWHDEAFSALLIHYPWGEMFYRIGLDVHPPAYYVALRLWSMLLGDSLLALRGFSVFFGLATAAATYGFVRDIFKSPRAATIAALAIVVNPFQIQYATEARMYTFGAFLAVSMAWVLAKALNSTEIKNKFKLFVAFGALAGIAALTHYYLLFSVVAACVYALLYTAVHFKKDIRAYAPLATGYLTTILLFLPWTNWFIFQFKQVGAGYWIPPLNWWSIPSTLWQVTFGLESDIAKTTTKITLAVTTIVLVSIFALLLKKQKNTHVWLVAFLFAAPFAGSLLFALLAFVKGQSSSVYLVRYFLYASAFLLAALALWIDSWKRSWLIWTATAAYAIVCVLVFANNWQKLDITKKTGMAGAATYLQSYATPTDKLYVGTSFEFFNLKYYLSQLTPPATIVTQTTTMSSSRYSLEDLSDDAPPAQIRTLDRTAEWPRPMLYSGGNKSVKNLPHFVGTAILTDEDLLPSFADAVKTGDTVWLLWTNAFGSNKPSVPSNWKQADEAGFADVRPYSGTWIVVTKYLVQ